MRDQCCRPVTDGTTTTYAYDALGRQTSQTTGGATTSYDYNLVGDQTSETDPDGLTTSYQYDALDRVTKETDPLGHSTEYAYNLAGDLTQKTDALGQVTQYGYDQLDEQTSETWYSSAAAAASHTSSNVMSYTYDLGGRLTSAGDPTTDYNYLYDALGDQTSETAALAGLTPTITLASAYDENGNRVRLAATIGSGGGAVADFINNYTYDPLGEMTQVKQQAQGSGSGYNAVAPKLVNFKYTGLEQLQFIDRYNAFSGGTDVDQTIDTYDGDGQLAKIVDTPAVGGFGSWIVNTYSHNRAGQLIQEKNLVAGTTTASYTYDTQGQLASATYASGDPRTSTTYTTDANGNRTDSGFTPATDSNELDSDGTFNYTYDADGNRISRTRISDGSYTLYGYDQRNRLVSVADYNASNVLQDKVMYTYDVFDRQITESIDSNGDASVDSRQFLVYDGTDAVLQFNDADGDGTTDAPALARRNFFADAVDFVLAEEDLSQTISAAARVLWHLTDDEGSTTSLLDNTGALYQSFKFDSFGVLVSATDSAGAALTTNPATAYLFTNLRYDFATALYISQSRIYDPSAERWLTKDWLDLGPGSNPYEYVGDDPNDFTDQTGLKRWDLRQGSDKTLLGEGVPQSTIDNFFKGFEDIGETLGDLPRYFNIPTNDFLLAGPDPDVTFREKDGTLILTPWRIINTKSQQVYYALPVYVNGTTDGKQQKVLAGFQVWDDPQELANDYRLDQALRAQLHVLAASAGIAAGLADIPPLKLGPRCPPNLSGPATQASSNVASGLAKIGELSAEHQGILKGIWRGEQPLTALPQAVREQLAGLYSRVAGQNPAGYAQAAFNEARAKFLLGQGPNPGPSVTDFAARRQLSVATKWLEYFGWGSIVEPFAWPVVDALCVVL